MSVSDRIRRAWADDLRLRLPMSDCSGLSLRPALHGGKLPKLAILRAATLRRSVRFGSKMSAVRIRPDHFDYPARQRSIAKATSSSSG